MIKIKHNNQHNKVAPLVRNGGSRHTGLAALPHKNIQIKAFHVSSSFEASDKSVFDFLSKTIYNNNIKVSTHSVSIDLLSA